MGATEARELPHITIGDAIQLYGMTPRAIRFYEEKRLVKAQRDHLNRRYYDATARSRLAWISRLRQAGVSLNDIRHVLNSGPDDSAAARRAKQKLEQRASHLQRELAIVTGALAGLESAAPR